MIQFKYQAEPTTWNSHNDESRQGPHHGQCRIKAAPTFWASRSQRNLAKGGMESREEGSRAVKEPGQAGSRPSFSPSGRHGKRQPAGLAPVCYF